MSYAALENHYRRLAQLRHVEAITSWDEATMMPTGGGEARAAALSTLRGMIHRETTRPEIAEWLAAGLAMSPPPPVPPVHRSPGFIMDNMTVDHVLGRDAPDSRVRLRTVVDILDEAAVRRSGAEYLVLHGNLLREFFQSGPERIRSFFVGRIREGLLARYGSPVFENDFITVFRVAGPT